MRRIVAFIFFIFTTSCAFALPATIDTSIKVTGMCVTDVTSATATLKWDAAPTTVVGYQYVINNQQVPPDKYGLFTKDTFYHAKALAAGATYYAHVRIVYQNARSSDWATVQFNTPAPPRPDDGSDKVFAVVVYPSQTDRSVTVKSKGNIPDAALVRIFDMVGGFAKDYNLIGDRISIDVGDLPSSIYYIRYLDDYGRMQIMRFTKTEKINTNNIFANW